jgi:hypothetical protein
MADFENKQNLLADQLNFHGVPEISMEGRYAY